MKKNFFGWLLIGAAAFTLGACSQDDDILSNDNAIAKGGKRTFNFEATIDAETRTTFNADYQLEWTAGDRLSFFTDVEGDENTPSNVYDGNNTFSVTLSPEATIAHALYPYELVEHKDWLAARLTFPQYQTQEKAGVLNGANLPLYAKTELTEGGDNQLSFVPQGSLIAFNVYCSTGTDNEKIKNIAFHSSFSGMNGDILYYFGNNWSYEANTNSFGSVTLMTPASIPQTKPTDKSGCVYLSVFSYYYTDNTFIVTTDKYVYVFESAEERDFTDKYKVQTINMNLANATKYEIDNLNSHFEDANFLKCLLKKYDMNQDGILSTFEVKMVQSLDCSNASIQSIKGLELFTEMTYLFLNDNNLSELNLPDNVATNLETLEFGHNNVTSVDVSKYVNLGALNCEGNQLTSLDVSKNEKLYWLVCGENNLSGLDLSHNTKLQSLSCGDNQLTSIDLGMCPDLKYLTVLRNQLTTLDVSKNTQLKQLGCGSNLLAVLDVSHNAELEGLTCEKNQLTTLDVSNNSELTTLFCNENQLTELDLSANTKLFYLVCSNNKLTKLDVSACNTSFCNVYCDGQEMPEGTTFQFIKAAGQNTFGTFPEGTETIEK